MLHTTITTLYLAVPTVDAGITGDQAVAPPGAKALLWGLSVIIWICFIAAGAGIARSGGHLAWAGIKPSPQGSGNAVTELLFGVTGFVVTLVFGVIMTTVAALL